MHCLIPDPITGRVPTCDCKARHVAYGETYQYCTCGRADKANQPWCDQTCQSGEYFPPGEWEPIPTHIDKKQTWWLMCGCKQTTKPPFCDGSHATIDWTKLEW